MKRQRAEISSNVISHIKSAHPIEMWRSNKLGIKEKISRGKFPRLIFSCPVPSGLPHRSHCVPMNMNPCGYRLFRWSEWRDLNSRPLDPQSFVFSNNSKTKRKAVKSGTIGAFEIPTFYFRFEYFNLIPNRFRTQATIKPLCRNAFEDKHSQQSCGFSTAIL